MKNITCLTNLANVMKYKKCPASGNRQGKGQKPKKY